MWLPNFLKYNAPESPNVVKSWKKLLDLLPECAMREDMLAKIKELIGKMSASFITAFQTVIEHVTVQVYRTRPALLEKKPQSPSPKSGAPSPRSGAIKDRQPEGLDDDFVAVRNAYNKIKPEGMLTGYDEYKELKRSGEGCRAVLDRQMVQHAEVDKGIRPWPQALPCRKAIHEHSGRTDRGKPLPALSSGNPDVG